MFKIKNNVNLYLLVNFGFIEGIFNFMRLNTCDSGLFWNETLIDKETRIIYERFEPCAHRSLVINEKSKYIQDLFQAGLVERV